MTEAEKLEEHAENSWLTWRDAVSDIKLSWAALAWCRANPKLVEALAKGTWQAVPKEPTSKILHGRMIEPRYVKAIYIDALAAAPKKPEE